MRALAVHQRRLEPAPRISLHGLNYGLIGALVFSAVCWGACAWIAYEIIGRG